MLMDKRKRKISYRTKLLVIVLFFLVAANLILDWFLMMDAQSALKQLMQDRMLDVANVAADCLDGDFLETMTADDVGSEGYNKVLRQFAVFQDNVQMDYIYALKKAGDKKFVFTIDPDPIDPGLFGEETIYTEALDAASRGIPSVDTMSFDDRWGRFYSAYSPIHNSDGDIVGVVAVDFDAKWYEQKMATNGTIVLLVSLCSLLAGAAVVFAVTGRIRKKFRAVNNELSVLAEDLENLASEFGIAAGESDSGKVLVKESGKLRGINYDDELAKLSDKLHFIHDELRQYINEARARAYIDVMTDVGNRTAYGDILRREDERISTGQGDFALVIVDINELKNINDNYGHENGDAIIVDTATILKRTFGRENVYRIGGDEFLAVMDNASEEDVKERIGALDEAVEKFNATEKTYEMNLALSRGYSFYEPEVDRNFKAVFKRADEAMYQNKREYYKKNGDRRRR